MSAIVTLIAGVFVAANIIVIMLKIKHDRIADAILDGTILILLAWIFGGSFAGLVTATVASSVISLYLLVIPPKLDF